MIKKEEFTERPWEIVSFMCDTCFKSSRGYEVLEGNLCEECDGVYSTPEYNHEDDVCKICSRYFQFEENVYERKDGSLVCEECL